MDPSATINHGTDVAKWLTSGKVIPVNASLGKLTIDDLYKNANYKRFLTNPISSKIANVLKDAQKVAKALKERIGRPSKVYWTGPTNDKSKFGAADIVSLKGNQEFPVSLKFGPGQLKNLGWEKMGNILLKGILKPGEDLINKVFTEEYKVNWDELTKEWMKLWYDRTKKLTEALKPGFTKLKRKPGFVVQKKGRRTTQTTQTDNIPNKNVNDLISPYLNLDFNGYQKQQFNDQEIEVAKKYVSVKKSKKIRDLLRDLYKQEKTIPKWLSIKSRVFKEIFDSFFSDRVDLIEKNLKEYFKTQMSAGDTGMWYASNSGKKILYIPDAEKFSSISNDLLDYKYSAESKPDSYNIRLTVTKKGGGKPISLITILNKIRWKDGQMNGKPSAVSSIVGKLDPDEWNKVFGAPVKL
jgi:hypothetical protein